MIFPIQRKIQLVEQSVYFFNVRNKLFFFIRNHINLQAFIDVYHWEEGIFFLVTSYFAVFLEFSTKNTHLLDNVKSQANKCHFKSWQITPASVILLLSETWDQGQGHQYTCVSWPHGSRQGLYIVVKRTVHDMPSRLPALYYCHMCSCKVE